MQLKIEYLPVTELKPYENNARKHAEADVEAIKKSIEEFGFNDPIGIWHDTIVEGHGRLLAAQELEMAEVPVIRLDHMTDEERRAYALAHNKTAELSEWDFEMLDTELEDIFDIDVSQFGFDISADDEPIEIIEDEVPETAPPMVKLGDIWQLGEHRLICGDSTDVAVIDRLMDGVKAQLLLTDPPYGVSFKSSSGLTIQNDSMKDEEFYSFLLAAFKNMANCLERGGAAYVFHADTEGLNFRRAFIDAGFHLAGCCIWVKDSLVLGRSDYQWQHEPVLYGFLQNGKHPWYSDRKQTTVWNFAKPKRNANHPTSKPLDLLAYPIGNSSQENSIVIDTFGGSGSTMMASEQAGRICYMMELDPKYASVILRRYVEDFGNADQVYVERGTEKIKYSDLVKEVEPNA